MMVRSLCHLQACYRDAPDFELAFFWGKLVV